ncbi:WD40-repeat-containing domain protein [Roridomyces roridus]|uniref:WD40-repeat-containing domain protein n=1 Tax=Roridomyces roridus TaxID=1738132 RepID=A0AAD7AYX4_9AGAR|nr:WD40-repeat-containing domain protein [Roridomyces roridus]
MSKHNPAYVIHAMLPGHSGPVMALVASEDGSLLASGGADGTRVWDLKSKRSLQVPAVPRIRAATTAITWTKRTDAQCESLAFGTQTGYVVCYTQKNTGSTTCFEESHCHRMPNPSEVTCIAFDTLSARLAVANRNGTVQVWSLAGENPAGLFTTSSDVIVPRALAFGRLEETEPEDGVLVFGLYEGNVYSVKAGGIMASKWCIGAHIGSVAFDSKSKTICMDDPLQGPRIYRLQDRTCTKAFSVPVTRTMRCRQVAFANGDKSIVSGSDHGMVYVHNRGSQEAPSRLSIGENDWVQTVGSTEYAGATMIFAAKSGLGAGKNSIVVWRARKGGRKCSGLSKNSAFGPKILSDWAGNSNKSEGEFPAMNCERQQEERSVTTPNVLCRAVVP